ncbi:3-hydroxyacyl-CoA dehydrogenase NAD-binding domain-containing protein [Oceanobacillus salinisoli]|uniref:3-hydroxyacyl-CoA dehydrogenase NAD-binding domain-containing protein n=1 Tax=Oceanobacillus salinisoli TaxID=2678611 RepID=UPI0012E1F659|nr:3-hydroxyacyl-CoA dehydrogenase NAD-binding domain-containing protein [Oceanobacillus salinisoli]
MKKSVIIIGAGTMGRSIAELFLQSNVNVLLFDKDNNALHKAKKLIEKQLVFLENKGFLSKSPKYYLSNIEITNHFPEETSTRLVIEAIPEKLNLKQELFMKLEEVCGDETIFATNTSGHSITEIASKLNHPERLIGTHFFTPAAIIPLVEVIKGKKTSEATVTVVMEMLTDIGKKPVLLHKEVPGFIGNRIQHAISREAISLLESGVATAEDIDTVVKWSIGLRMVLTGPIEQRDINGLDVHYDIASYLYKDLNNELTPSSLLKEKVEKGETGLKVNKGFYNWENVHQESYLNDKDNKLIDLVHWLK